jgi:hypothetical protein
MDDVEDEDTGVKERISYILIFSNMMGYVYTVYCMWVNFEDFPPK